MIETREECTKFISWLHRQPGRLVDLYDYDPDLYPNETRSLKLSQVEGNPHLWFLKQNEKYSMKKPKV
jgi:hypothetical protein